VLANEPEVVGVCELGETDLNVSLELGDRGLVRLGEVELGELCAERYRLPDEGCVRNVGSERLARALDVFSRASWLRGTTADVCSSFGSTLRYSATG
jgi:hypothetical protein